MELTFDEVIRVSNATDLVEIQRGADDAVPTIPSSKTARGLAMRSLHVTRDWDGLWKLLGRRQQIYFLPVAFDLSGRGPVVLPPATVPADAVYPVRRGEAIKFTLGDGAPSFLLASSMEDSSRTSPSARPTREPGMSARCWPRFTRI